MDKGYETTLFLLLLMGVIFAILGGLFLFISFILRRVITNMTNPNNVNFNYTDFSDNFFSLQTLFMIFKFSKTFFRVVGMICLILAIIMFIILLTMAIFG